VQQKIGLTGVRALAEGVTGVTKMSPTSKEYAIELARSLNLSDECWGHLNDALCDAFHEGRMEGRKDALNQAGRGPVPLTDEYILPTHTFSKIELEDL
jgi:hypothetical protein